MIAMVDCYELNRTLLVSGAFCLMVRYCVVVAGVSMLPAGLGVRLRRVDDCFTCCFIRPTTAYLCLLLMAWGSDMLHITAGCSVSRIFYIVFDSAQWPKNRFDCADQNQWPLVWWSLQMGKF